MTHPRFGSIAVLCGMASVVGCGKTAVPPSTPVARTAGLNGAAVASVDASRPATNWRDLGDLSARARRPYCADDPVPPEFAFSYLCQAILVAKSLPRGTRRSKAAAI